MSITEPLQFAGFPPAGFAFLRELATNNDTAWFDAHRATYETAVRDPARAFVLAVGEALRERGITTVRAEPAVGRSLFRINRDTRFSRDKTPYNPYLDVVLWEGTEPRRSPAFLIRISGTEVTTGTGVMGRRDERLDRFRTAVADDTTGRQLTRVLEQLVASVPSVNISTPSRKRVPAGFPPEHPRADLLKLDALHATSTEPLPDASTSPGFAGWVADRHLRFAPLHRWLVANLEDRS